MYRKLCVETHRWIEASDFEDALAACNLLPGPASTQLSIYCAWRVRGRIGALVGGAAFIVPGLLLILALSALFLADAPPSAVLGAAAGAGAAVAAVAVHAGRGFLPASWRRAALVSRARWFCYLAAGGAAAAFIGPWVVVALLMCGAAELSAQRVRAPNVRSVIIPAFPFLAVVLLDSSTALHVAWVAFKVGALSYGGGFVIIPLMQHDAVNAYHWMSAAQFLNAVALGQITPGPVVQTVAVVGYAAGGVGGGLLAALVAFSPSFAFIIIGGHKFDQLRKAAPARAFLDGAGPAAIGAIFGSAVPLARGLSEYWQIAILGGAALALFALRRSVVLTLLTAAAIGAGAAAMGAPLPH